MIERLVDTAAREMNIDRAELRRRNLIPPNAIPYHAPNGMVYDSGEFEAVMDKALALADWSNQQKIEDQNHRDDRDKPGNRVLAWRSSH